MRQALDPRQAIRRQNGAVAPSRNLVNLEAVSKAFGEALGALYSDKHGMSVTCLRIGNVGPRPLVPLLEILPDELK